MAGKLDNNVQHDPVRNPSHYTQGKVECIEAIEAALGQEGFISFLRGQVIKYSWRLGKKDDAVQDAGKAKWYQDLLVEKLLEKQLQTQKEAKAASTFQGEALTETQLKGTSSGYFIGNRYYDSPSKLSAAYPGKLHHYDTLRTEPYVTFGEAE